MLKLIACALLSTSTFSFAEDVETSATSQNDGLITVVKSDIDDGSKLTYDYTKFKLSKDEFETRKQYLERIEPYNNKTHYFVMSYRNYGSRGVSYDPEKQALIYDFLAGSDNGDNYPVVDLDGTRKTVGHYIGSNAFGTKVRIDKVVWLMRTAVLRTGFDNKGSRTTYHFTGEFGLDSVNAKKIKDRLMLLLVGNVDIDEVKINQLNLPPTIDSTDDVDKIDFRIPIDLKGLYLYDPKTNKVLSKLTFAPIKSIYDIH